MQQQSIIHTAYAPLVPAIALKIMNEGTVLNVSWQEPYSSYGFPVISYTLMIYNNATSNTSNTILPADTTYYLANSSDTMLCSWLEFTITAENSLGSSNWGFISGGFPMCESMSQSEVASSLLQRVIISP